MSVFDPLLPLAEGRLSTHCGHERLASFDAELLRHGAPNEHTSMTAGPALICEGEGFGEASFVEGLPEIDDPWAFKLTRPRGAGLTLAMQEATRTAPQQGATDVCRRPALASSLEQTLVSLLASDRPHISPTKTIPEQGQYARNGQSCSNGTRHS